MVLIGIVVFKMSILIMMASTEDLNCTSEENDLKLSGVKDIWTNTPPYCHMAGFDYFSSETLSKLRDILPVEENVWIHARANNTPYFIFRSCLKQTNKSQVFETKQFRDNSVSRCLAHCQEINVTVFGLMGDKCICIHDPKVLIAEHSVYCCLGCPGNLNDCCGNNGTIIAVYDFYPVREWVDPEVEIDRRCAIVNNTLNQTFVRKCTNAYRVKCSRKTVSQTKFKWSGAMDYCRNHSSIVDSNVTHYQNLSSSVYVWAPLQRSSQLHWVLTTNASDYPWCISIRKDKDERLSLHEEYCETKLRHCVVCEPVTHELNIDTPRTTMYVLIATAAIGITLLTGFAMISTFTKRKSKPRPTTNTILNGIYEADVPSRVLTDTPIPITANVSRTIYNTQTQADRVQDPYSYADAVFSHAATNTMTTNEIPLENNGVTLTGYHINTVAEFAYNSEDSNMYDSTNNVFKEEEHRANLNIYAHTQVADQDNWQNENVYDRSKTNIKPYKHDEQMYDHAKAIVKDKHQKNNVYGNISTATRKNNI